MKLAFFLCFIGAILSSCAAAIVAGEAWRLSDARTFKIAISLATPLAIVTISLFFVGAANHFFDGHPSDHLGFGPDWHCLTNSPRVGGDFCIRDVPSKSQP